MMGAGIVQFTCPPSPLPRPPQQPLLALSQPSSIYTGGRVFSQLDGAWKQLWSRLDRESGHYVILECSRSVLGMKRQEGHRKQDRVSPEAQAEGPLPSRAWSMCLGLPFLGDAPAHTRTHRHCPRGTFSTCAMALTGDSYMRTWRKAIKYRTLVL